MIRTFTPSEAMALTLPGDLPGLGHGWCGPGLTKYAHADEWGPDSCGNWGDQPGKSWRLPLDRWECRARVAQWLAEKWCVRHQRSDAHDLDGLGPNGPGYWSGDNPEQVGHRQCHDGNRSPMWWALDGPGKVEPWVSAALLYVSALRASKGMGAVPGTLNAWRMVTKSDPDTGETWIRGPGLDPMNRGGGLWAGEKVQTWREFGWESGVAHDPTTGLWLRGPETGELGKAKADEAALKAGFALMGTNEITVEVASAE